MTYTRDRVLNTLLSKQHCTINELAENIDTHSAEYEKLIISEEMRALYGEFQKSYNIFIPHRDQIIKLALAGKKEEALTYLRGAAFASAKAAEARAEANLIPARLKEERYRDLVKIKAVSQQDYDNAYASLKQAEAEIGFVDPKVTDEGVPGE